MKLFLSASTFILLISILSLEAGLSSCTKDHTIYDTVTVNHTDTVTVKDTVIIKDTVLTESLLTAHPWKMEELRGLLEGTVMYYKRGGSGNTVNFDSDYVVFNADKTGSSVDGASATHEITHWELSTTDKTTLVFTIHNTPSITSVITWDNIRFKNGNMYYDDYYLDNNTGYDFHGQEIRTPK
jgi:hypothetical protein